MSLSLNLMAQKTQIALLKYRGGGDWYSNPTSLPNLVKFCNQNINTNINTNPNAKSKIAAGILGIILGCFGVHNFYLGFTGKAIAQLLITLLSCFFIKYLFAKS